MVDAANVRSATAADCHEIYRIQVAAIRGLPGGAQGKDGIEKWLATRKPSVYATEMEVDRFVVAETADGEVLGWGALSIDKQEITNVFVDPAHHRCGVGTLIIRALEDTARAADLQSVQLQATGTAIVFYLASGYQSDPPVEQGAAWALMKKAL